MEEWRSTTAFPIGFADSDYEKSSDSESEPEPKPVQKVIKPKKEKKGEQSSKPSPQTQPTQPVAVEVKDLQADIEEKLLQYVATQKMGLRSFSFNKDWGSAIPSDEEEAEPKVRKPKNEPDADGWTTVKKKERKPKDQRRKYQRNRRYDRRKRK